MTKEALKHSTNGSFKSNIPNNSTTARRIKKDAIKGADNSVKVCVLPDNKIKI